MKKLLSLGVLFLATASYADVIECHFTEPFYVTTYNMNQSTLLYSEVVGSDQMIKNVSFQIKDAGVFELVDKNGKILQTLTLNHQGSNGMSDTIYPYEVKDESSMLSSNLGYGGCVSKLLPAIEPAQ